MEAASNTFNDGPMRRRKGKEQWAPRNPYIPGPGNHRDDRHGVRYALPTPDLHFLALLVGIGAAFALVTLVPERLPTPLMLEDEAANPGRFIAERAKNILLNLTGIGPRVSGSHENEYLAANLIRDEIDKVTRAAKSVHEIAVDVQRVSGAFPLTFLDGMTHVYSDVQNVVVKVAPPGGSNHSVLMNCHFDTVPDSPGATDDASSCVIMLEILRLITHSTEPVRHNIVLLFNGAEENFMQASHGFITQHKWAKEVRVVVNLESCGAGGREIMFQSGPNHPWLIELYANNVAYPFGSSIAQEIFQSGIFPGDTDYRIFRDFGGVPGLDFTWYLNGYVYHTQHDNAANVPLGTLQRTGDNMLSLVRALIRADELSNTTQHKHGNIVFFDVLGSFVVFWSLVAGDVINITALLLSMYSIMCNLKEADHRGLSKHTYTRQLAVCLGVVLLSWLASFLVSTCVALTLTTLGKAMSWFSRPAWLVFLYAIPTLTTSMSVLLWKSRQQRKVVVSPWTLFQLYYDTYQVIWSVMLFAAAVFRLQSAFVPLFWVLFPSTANIIRLKMFKHLRDSKWILLHGAMILFPFIQCSYLLLYGLQFFIPILGRGGAAHNSELIVSILSTVMLNFLLSYIVPIILLVRTPSRVISLCMAISITAAAILIFTPLGFPYSADPNRLVPQKFAVLHVRRLIHDFRGQEVRRETGFWLVDLDMNSPSSLHGIVPEISRARPTDEDCDKYLYCGMPYYIPIRSFIWKTHWIDGEDVNIPMNTSLHLLAEDVLPGSLKRYTFNLSGPDHMELMISPFPGIDLHQWNFSKEQPLAGPRWNDRETYFVYFAYAGVPKTWYFYLDMQVPEGWRGPVVEVAVGSHFLHGPYQRSHQLTDFIRKFPDWSAVTGWQATYQLYVF